MELDDYRTENLFLLIGTNPLPNYVAAKLLLKPGGRLYLIHSEGTRPAAQRLFAYWVGQEKGEPPICVPVSEVDGPNIECAITTELEAIKEGRVGLNYTGGTKVMSVHVYQVIRDFSVKLPHPPVLSYLDAYSNKMIFDRPPHQTVVSESVLCEVSPTLEQLVSLHAARLVTGIERTAKLPDLAAELAQAHLSPDAARSWRSWCDGELRPKTQTKRTHQWDDEGLLRKVELLLPSDETLGRLVALWRKRFRVDGLSFSLECVRQQAGFGKAKHLCEWLDGKWLEYHVLSLVQGLQVDDLDCRLHDCGMGIKPQAEPERPEFDVDIGVMQGYRLYAITCTTDADPGLCKLKLFEAYERARNMGGDEAFVGLVCCSDRPQQLEHQIGRSWDVKDKIRVFGRPHMSDLAKHLADWFKSTGH